MRVIVTGGAGFVGTMLATRLLAGPVEVGGGEPAPVDELVLADLVAPTPDASTDTPVCGPRAAHRVVPLVQAKVRTRTSFPSLSRLTGTAGPNEFCLD